MTRGTTRLHIVGGPGSGKTTLAREASVRLEVESVDLDRLAFDRSKPFGTRTSQDRLALEVQAILADRVWVTEGIYLGWTAPLLEQADVIVWLDPPARVALWRVVARHARASMCGTNEFKGLRRLARFLRSSLYYYRGPADVSDEVMALDEEAITRAATRNVLRRWDDKVRRCRTRRDRRRALESVERGGAQPCA